MTRLVEANDAPAMEQQLAREGQDASVMSQFDSQVTGISAPLAKAQADSLCRHPFYWDAEAVRTREGFYRVRGGIQVSLLNDELRQS